jgi:hypothetical protein
MRHAATTTEDAEAMEERVDAGAARDTCGPVSGVALSRGAIFS